MTYADYAKTKANVIRWQKENREQYNARTRNWYQRNLERERKRGRDNAKRLRQENPERAKEADKRFRAKHLPSILAKNAARRARLRQRIASWVDLKAIREFYKNCPSEYHVDHIIPLLGKNVSGLHCLENLQYLPRLENIAKGNKFIN